MLRANAAPIASVRSYGRVLFAAGVVLIVFGFVQLYTHVQSPTLRAGNRTYYLEIVTSLAAQEQGLSGVQSMPPDQGMLFSFTNEAQRCFWMKGMAFPLDMIWLDSKKQVVHLETNVSPNTYPKVFCANEPAQYVIELNAGQVQQAGINSGQTLQF